MLKNKIILTLLVFVCLSGCSIKIGRTVHAPQHHDHTTHEHNGHHKNNEHSPHRADALTHKEIKAAASLPSSADRFLLLHNIAKRNNLSPDAQVALIHTLFNRVTSSADRFTMLNTLIDNPAFSETAHHTILDNIKRIPSSADRLSVLKKLSEVTHNKPLLEAQPSNQLSSDPSEDAK